jgi:hypothetical protein
MVDGPIAAIVTDQAASKKVLIISEEAVLGQITCVCYISHVTRALLQFLLSGLTVRL